MIRFADAVLGPAALVDAAAVLAIYEGLDRIADTTGIPIDEERLATATDLRARPGIEAYPSRAGGSAVGSCGEALTSRRRASGSRRLSSCRRRDA